MTLGEKCILTITGYVCVSSTNQALLDLVVGNFVIPHRYGRLGLPRSPLSLFFGSFQEPLGLDLERATLTDRPHGHWLLPQRLCIRRPVCQSVNDLIHFPHTGLLAPGGYARRPEKDVHTATSQRDGRNPFRVRTDCLLTASVASSSGFPGLIPPHSTLVL